MSNVQKADPYRKLLKLLIALLVLFVLVLTAYLLLDSYKRGQYEEQQRQVIEANNRMVEEYNRQVLAQREEEVPDVAPSWPLPAAEGIDIVELKGYAVKGRAGSQRAPGRGPDGRPDGDQSLSCAAG